MGRPVPGLTSKTRVPISTPLDARRLVSDLLQVRSGRAPNGALPSAAFFFHVFAYRFCDSEESICYDKTKSTGSQSMLGQSVSIGCNAPSLCWWSSLRGWMQRREDDTRTQGRPWSFLQSGRSHLCFVLCS